MWNQVYNPFGNATLSTCFAALPVITLLVPVSYTHLTLPMVVCSVSNAPFSTVSW